MYKSKMRERKSINYYEPVEPRFDEFIYCENCYDFVYEYCAIHGPLLVIPDKKVSRAGIPPWVPRAALTTPRPFVHIARSSIPGAGLGVFSSLTLPRGVRFGPYRGKRSDEINSIYSWQIRSGNNHSVVDGSNADASNWMRYVNCARNYHEQNLLAFQYKGQIYYRTVKVVPKFTELLVFYGSEFANALGIDLKYYNDFQNLGIVGKYIIENVNSNEADNNHRDSIYGTEVLEICEEISKISYNDAEQNFDKVINNVNEENANKNGNVEQLEDIEHSCTDAQQNFNKVINNVYEENANKNGNDEQQEHNEQIPFINQYSEVTIDLNKSKINIKNAKTCNFCLKKIAHKNFTRHKKIHYAKPLCCTHCNFKTIYKRSLSNHLNIHTLDEIYQCDSCLYIGHNKANFRRHTKKAHDIILSVNDSLTKYKITDLEKYSFNCPRCSYKTNFENIYYRHIETHMKFTTYVCDLCNNGCKNRRNLISHINNVHYKKCNRKIYKCTICRYGTNRKSYFTSHMKSHTKNDVYNCDMCTYEGHGRRNILRHIRKYHRNNIM